MPSFYVQTLATPNSTLAMPIPKPTVIKTERLLLRPLHDEDVSAFMAVMGDDAVTRYLSRIPRGNLWQMDMLGSVECEHVKLKMWLRFLPL